MVNSSTPILVNPSAPFDRKDVLEQAVLANGGPVPGVRSFVRNGAP
jgi:hypothetical protein